eukprot:gnl/TRDRNA2_/TRDRNA2_125806_c0_seq1.p1 gnl/TRDRNA2_/TRDRNA2_125806_c0~~gnl/TRDRNA2_/TRDRNA2_125806_c0_seq1.p1  ORF type:complete len:502 (+),score=76.61 gnl/TRDRNA2_/TRDRNA2_125806_c0_seq1:130-1635(+)
MSALFRSRWGEVAYQQNRRWRLIHATSPQVEEWQDCSGLLDLVVSRGFGCVWDVMSTEDIVMNRKDGMYNRGVIAADDAAEGQGLFSFPLELALDDAKRAEDGEVLSNSKWNVRLAVRLVKELLLSKESQWGSYVRTLPPQVPALWWLFACGMASGALDIQENRNRMHSLIQYPTLEKRAEQMALSMIATYQDLATMGLLQNATLDQYLWAVSMVHSRNVLIQVDGNSRRVLMPFFDLINHGGPDGESSSSEIENVKLAVNEDTMYIGAVSNIERGKELFLSYGRRSNDDFLMYFGFVPDDNPDDDFILFKDIEEVFSWYGERARGSPEEQHFQERVRIAREAVEKWIQIAAGDGATVNVKGARLMLLPSGAIDSRLLLALVAFAASSPSAADVLNASVVSDPRVVCDRVGEQDLQKAQALLNERCQWLLDSFPSKLEDDEASVSAEETDSAEKMLAKFRVSKKRILFNSVKTPYNVWRDNCEFFNVFQGVEKEIVQVRRR